MKYHPDRKPGGAQNADRDARPTDAEAKESKNPWYSTTPLSLSREREIVLNLYPLSACRGLVEDASIKVARECVVDGA